MYAIVEVAGKQYKVTKGLNVYVDRLESENESKINLDKVLLLSNEGDVEIGMPYVDNVYVEAVVKNQEFKDKKVIVFKYKNKTGFHKKQGHRHKYTLLEIQDIVTGAKPAKKEAKVVAQVEENNN